MAYILPLRRKVPISPSKSREALLFNPDPSAYLPHRTPFLFLDRITFLDPGRAAKAIITPTCGTDGWPIFLCVEAMAQLGGIAAAAEEGGGGILGAIDHAEFHSMPAVGEPLTVAVRIIKAFGPLNLVEGDVSSGDRVLASATITLRVGKPA